MVNRTGTAKRITPATNSGVIPSARNGAAKPNEGCGAVVAELGHEEPGEGLAQVGGIGGHREEPRARGGDVGGKGVRHQQGNAARSIERSDHVLARRGVGGTDHGEHFLEISKGSRQPARARGLSAVVLNEQGDAVRLPAQTRVAQGQACTVADLAAAVGRGTREIGYDDDERTGRAPTAVGGEEQERGDARGEVPVGPRR